MQIRKNSEISISVEKKTEFHIFFVILCSLCSYCHFYEKISSLNFLAYWIKGAFESIFELYRKRINIVGLSSFSLDIKWYVFYGVFHAHNKSQGFPKYDPWHQFSHNKWLTNIPKEIKVNHKND